MTILCDDIWLIIILLINDKDKVNLLTTCKYLRYFRDKIYYTDIHDYRRVLYLPFFNNFKLLSYTAETSIIPNGIKYLTISNNFRGNLKSIPLSIEKITIDYSIYNRFESFLKTTGVKINILNKPIMRQIKSSFYSFMDVLEDTSGPKCGIIKSASLWGGNMWHDIHTRAIGCGLITSIEPFSGYNTEDGILSRCVIKNFSNHVYSLRDSYEDFIYKLHNKNFNTTDDPSKKIPLKKLLKKYNKKEKVYHPHNNKFYKNNKYNQKFIPRHK
ncbi:hypothetical protein QJ854_gp833 [Moumouvirus goulette]|uniref:Uncharacterized protein n=1 Tax=Moumouvirus goulette TaxID=1247379 RepID=M1PAT5_9VIRU|nr:hypothetical protein QJ854_gp833 [Moumouvirus goulette]AGF84949.1 hypothetical protein glt_00140 [Moumouvirus goulette]